MLYVGQIELDNIGLNGTPANERRYSDERLREAFFTARDVAQTMDELGYDVLWTAEHHFQREGYECLPEPDPARPVARDADQAAEVRLRLQRAADVAPDPPRRRLRDGRHRHRRPHHHGGRPRLSHARGGNLRRAAARRGQANRELFEEQLELLLKCFNEEHFHHKGKYYECPPPVRVSRLPAQRHHHGAAAEASAGRHLDADRERQDHRADGAVRPQGDGDAERARRSSTTWCAPITTPAQRTAGRSSSART